MDIFFTQTGQYLVPADPATLSARFIAAFSNRAYNGVLLPESGFRMGLPLSTARTPAEMQPAYLSGKFEPHVVQFPPAFPPATVLGEAPVPVSGPALHTLVEFRLRPNLFLVLLIYTVSILFLADFLGLELFWKYEYYVWKILLYILVEILLVVGTFRCTTRLKKRFEEIL